MERFMEYWNEIKKDASGVDEDYVQKIWDWFGDNGAFIGGVPFGADYSVQGMTDEARTPFERLYYVHDALRPIVALRLRRGAIKEKRINDTMEIIMRRNNMRDPENDLVLYPINWKEIPEPYSCVNETEFLSKFPGGKAIRIV